MIKSRTPVKFGKGLSSPGVRAMRHYLALTGAALLLSGCSFTSGSVMNPGGPVGFDMRELLFFVGAVMLLVLIPVYVLTLYYGWKYRGENKTATYKPNWRESKPITIATWVGPAAIILLFSVVLWHYTHLLDPYRPVPGEQKTVEIEAIAHDWKWVFIYPNENNLVTVNEIKFPVGAPVRVRITSDTVMNSFMLQGLTGQIYAMAGMETQLNLRADRPGVYLGRNMQFSGGDFPKQQFTATAVSQDEYQQWVASIQKRPALSDNDYQIIAKKGTSPVMYYGTGGANRFIDTLSKFIPARLAEGTSLETPPVSK